MIWHGRSSLVHFKRSLWHKTHSVLLSDKTTKAPFRLSWIEVEGSVPRSISSRKCIPVVQSGNRATRKTAKRAGTFPTGPRVNLHLPPKGVPMTIRWSYDSFAFLTPRPRGLRPQSYRHTQLRCCVQCLGCTTPHKASRRCSADGNAPVSWGTMSRSSLKAHLVTW